MGILEKDENITEQMIEVMQHLQQYVPKTNDGKLIPIMLGGDALSVERGEAASQARMDAITDEDTLEGFTWKSEDWHGHVISLQVFRNFIYLLCEEMSALNILHMFSRPFTMFTHTCKYIIKDLIY